MSVTKSNCATLLQWLSYLLILVAVLVFLFVAIDDMNGGAYGGAMASAGILVSAAIIYGFSVVVRAAQAYINRCEDETPAEE